jgi:diguanylate cyclase (GGDEF)-like protein/PAS domain S-box-containing protein
MGSKQREKEKDTLTHLVEHASIALGTASMHGIITYANATLLATLGYGDALIGTSFADLFTEDAAYLQQVLHQVRTHGMWEGTLQRQNHAGITTITHISLSLLPETPEHAALISILVRSDEPAPDEQNRRYEQAFTSGRVGIWDWQLATNDIYLAPSLKALLGYTDAEITNHMDAWITHVHPDDIPLVAAATEACLDGSAPGFEVEHRMLHKDGTIRWFIARGNVLFDAEGQPVRMLGTDTDITERKKTEQALETRAHQQAAVATFGHHALVETDLDVLMQEAIAIITRTLHMEYGSLQEAQPGQQQLRLRASIGWREEFTTRTCSADATSHAGYTLLSHTPIIVEDMRSETRFNTSMFATHGVTSGISVVIQGRERPFGVLSVYTRQRRQFTDDDVHFLQSVATMLAVVIERLHVEDELEQQRRFLKQVIDINPNLIFARNRDGHFTLVNHAMAHLYDTTVQALIGRTDADVNPNAEAVEAIRREDLEVMTTLREKIIPEKRIIDTEGKTRWLQTVKRPILDSDGTANHVLGVAMDITKRKQAEEALWQSKNRLRRILEASPDGMLVIDQHGRVNYANPMARLLLDQQTLETHFFGYPLDTSESSEVEVIQQSGRRVILEMRVIETEWDDQRSYVVSLRDVTERKHIEIELRESRARLKAIFDNAAVGISLIAPDGRFIETNDRAAEMLGYPVATLLRMTHLDFTHPDDVATTTQVMTALLEGHQNTHQIEQRLLGKDNHMFWGNVSFTAIRNERGTLEAIIAIITDITERKQAEEALQQAHEQRVAELEDYNLEITLLNAMSDRLHRCETDTEIYRTVEYFAEQLFEHHPGALYITSTDHSMLEVVATWGAGYTGEPSFPVSSCTLLWSEGSYPTTPCMCKLDYTITNPSPDTEHNAICVPLITHGEKFGLLRLYGETSVSPPLHDTLRRLARIVTEHLALALTNLRMRERMRELAIRDPLTGLFNRRYLDETLIRELRRASRHSHPVGVIMLDIDHFKGFNDTYGHDAGDALLREMAAFLQRHTRKDDIACRYGGEEFMLILPGAELAHTRRRAEDLRTGVRNLQVQHNGQWLGQITISVGVAVFPEHGDNDEEVVKAADKALYRAKRQGRDRVITGWRKGMTDRLDILSDS